MFVIVWQFDVRPDHINEFEVQYGSAGTWAQFFSRSEHFLNTRLLKDTGHPERYVTLDLWQSEAAFLEFAAAFAQEYKDLDAKLEKLTMAETRLGSFNTDAAYII